MRQEAETRVTDWNDCKDGPWYPSLPHGGYVAYRIWVQTDGLRWLQRHEWKRADGSIETGEWINGVTGFGAHMRPVAVDQISSLTPPRPEH